MPSSGSSGTFALLALFCLKDRSFLSFRPRSAFLACLTLLARSSACIAGVTKATLKWQLHKYGAAHNVVHKMHEKKLAYLRNLFRSRLQRWLMQWAGSDNSTPRDFGGRRRRTCSRGLRFRLNLCLLLETQNGTSQQGHTKTKAHANFPFNLTRGWVLIRSRHGLWLHSHRRNGRNHSTSRRSTYTSSLQVQSIYPTNNQQLHLTILLGYSGSPLARCSRPHTATWVHIWMHGRKHGTMTAQSASLSIQSHSQKQTPARDHGSAAESWTTPLPAHHPYPQANLPSPLR